MSTPISSSSTAASSTPTASTSSGPTAATKGTTSSGSASQPFQIFGLASGLDTGTIIDKLVAVYSAPQHIAEAQQATTLQKQSAWNDIQTKMNTLQTSIQTLQGASAAAGRVGMATAPAGAGQTAAVSVTATPNAALSTLSVNVQSLATTGTLSGGAGLSAPITTANATSAALTAEGFGVTPTTGTVTINGTKITIDSTTTLLGAGGSDSVQAKLAAAGVTLTPVTSGANVTGVTLSSAAPLQLGVPSDTSNLLTVLRLTTAAPSGGGTTITSNGSLSGNALGTPLTSLRLATPLTATSGSFSINGASISFSATDTLGSITAKINSSTAGVTATYDPLSDRMMLTANSTGTGGISVADGTGSNLMAALNLTGGSATSNPGMPAVFTISGINGGNPIASATNTVANVVPGVTLTLLAPSPTMTTAGATTVAINPDMTTLTTSMQSFVTAYNAVQDTITKYSGIQLDSTGSAQSAGILAGDPGLSTLAQSLDQTVNGISVKVAGKKYSMAELGVSTGIVGSYNATTVPTLDLQFDASKLSSSLASIPTLAQGFIGNGSVSSQQGTLFQSLNAIVNSWTSPLGNIGSSLDALSADYSNEQQTIQQWQDFATAQRAQLVTMFTSMETSLSSIQTQGNALLSALGASTTSSSSSSTTKA